MITLLVLALTVAGLVFLWTELFSKPAEFQKQKLALLGQYAQYATAAFYIAGFSTFLGFVLWSFGLAIFAALIVGSGLVFWFTSNPPTPKP